MPWLLLIIKHILPISELYSSFRRTDLTTGDILVASVGGPRLVFRASLTRKCPGITAWFRLDSGTNQFKAGKYVVGIGI